MDQRDTSSVFAVYNYLDFVIRLVASPETRLQDCDVFLGRDLDFWERNVAVISAVMIVSTTDDQCLCNWIMVS